MTTPVAPAGRRVAVPAADGVGVLLVSYDSTLLRRDADVAAEIADGHLAVGGVPAPR